MKIAIIGYSGAGKSTLARKLGSMYGAEVLHFDAVQFLPGWNIREEAEKARITKEFLDTHDSWVIDGNYTKLFYERRMEEADAIVALLPNRFRCLFRVIRRYQKYKNTTRPDMAPGCNEKLDREFIRWVFFDGRTRQRKAHYRSVIAQYREKVIVVKNRKQWDACLEKLSYSQAGRGALQRDEGRPGT